MTGLVIALAVAGAGGLGAAARYLVESTLGAFLGRRGRPGWGLAAINILGSGIIGVLAALAARSLLAAEWQTVVATGFLGGFTTFSAASLDVVETDRSRGRNAAIRRALVVPLGAIAACALGYWVGSVPG